MEIVKAPSAALTGKAKPVTKVDKQILDIIQDMKNTLLAAKDPEGVGLAAPQIGKSFQIFIIKPTNNASITIFINPRVTLLEENSPISAKTSGGRPTNDQLEGCLSLQNIWGTVKRSPKVLVTYLDETGKQHTKTFNKFPAVIIQHEFDHLNGVLFPKRVLEQQGKLYKSKKDKNGKDIFEELDL